MSAEVVGEAIHEVFCRGNAPMHSDRHHSAEALISKINAAGYDVARIEEGERPLDAGRLRRALMSRELVVLDCRDSGAIRMSDTGASEAIAAEYAALAASDEAARP